MREHVVRKWPVNTGLSGWYALSHRTMPVQTLATTESVDWLIIGAGFAGLSAARRLSQLHPGSRIAVVDAKRIAEGPAGRNSGFMIDLPHNLSSGHYSPGDAAQSRMEIAHNRHAIEFAGTVAEEYGLSADTFNRCGKLNASATERGEKHNADYARSLGLVNEPYTLLDAQQMREMTGSAYYSGGIHTPGAVIIQPADYIHGLAQGLQSAVQFYEESPVLGLRREGNVWTAQTAAGRISAPKVILAVNGSAESFGFYRRRLMHIYTYASMTRALQPGMAGFGQTGYASWGILPADPMGATLRKVTVAGAERIVIRTRFTFDPSMRVSDARLAGIVAEQRRSFDARFPHLNGLDFEYSWAGALCLSLNSVPAFGEIDESLYSACCENGLGTVKSTLAGVLAAELAADVPSPRLTEFMSQAAPRRLPPTPLAYLGANASLRWQEWRAGREG